MDKIDNKFKNLKKAFQKLKEGTEIVEESEIIRDGIIQRFEFTFELAWKTLKSYFEYMGIQDLHFPKDVLKEAYRVKIIENQNIWLDMLNDRNLTSHVYKEELAIEICNNIKSNYVFELEKMINNLENFEK